MPRLSVQRNRGAGDFLAITANGGVVETASQFDA
jgi:hypothetical protein